MIMRYKSKIWKLVKSQKDRNLIEIPILM